MKRIFETLLKLCVSCGNEGAELNSGDTWMLIIPQM